MISQAQAFAVADRWINPHGPQGEHRDVALQEFDLGYVVWAKPAPMQVDPVTGQRRPPADFGDSSGVVDKQSGELSIWPSVPVEEVIRMYREKHAPASAPQPSGPSGERPVTGPGNTAVFTYIDPANGEETTLFRNSAPGMPHAEYQAWAELRRLNVPPGNVVAVHTDLRPSLLPGGYTGDFILKAFPNAQFSCTQGYGMFKSERAEGVAALLEHVETIYRISGQQPPPRPHRLPLPESITRVEPMRDVALGRHLAEAFGTDGVRRYDADDMTRTELPETTRSTLTWAGLPADVPFFFTADQAGEPPAGGLFTDVATHLREREAEASAEILDNLAGHVRIGSDGLCVITVQCRGGEDFLGAVWAAHPVSGTGRFVNRSVGAFNRCLVLLAETRERMEGLDPVAAGAEVARFQERIAAVDNWALNADDWWDCVIDQMWDGLF